MQHKPLPHTPRRAQSDKSRNVGPQAPHFDPSCHYDAEDDALPPGRHPRPDPHTPSLFKTKDPLARPFDGQCQHVSGFGLRCPNAATGDTPNTCLYCSLHAPTPPPFPGNGQ